VTERQEARRLRIGMAQINTTVGDFTGNRQKILQALEQAMSSGVDLLTFPELTTCGYPPEDLLFKPQFITENLKSLEKIVADSSGLNVVVGFVNRAGSDIYNAAAVIHDGKLTAIYHKVLLPNYGVFDEIRYFQPGKQCPVFVIAGVNTGINICEDIWYANGPAATQARSGAELIVNISASPYHFGKGYVREEMLIGRATDNLAIIAFTNLIGGQDELIFDGGSILVSEKGEILARGKQFEEDFIIADIDIGPVIASRLQNPGWNKEPGFPERPVETVSVSEKSVTVDKPKIPPKKAGVLDFPAEVYCALVLGTHDYIKKNGFGKVLVGLSGGLDSSLVAAIGVDALGKDNLVGVAMPSPYSSTGSVTDAELLAKNLGIQLLNVRIDKVFKEYLDMLSEPFRGKEPDVAEENIQARIRGTILMALSNKFGWLVLTTGNKSEMATGYATLYGDMAGGFAVIKDIPKTMAYKLAEYRNSLGDGEVIPDSVITKPPSAELRPDQKDTDSLPPYEILDPILTAYVEEDKSIEEIIAAGNNEAVVRRVARLVDISEYKRRQAPPGIKITPRAFGRDRRLPITNRYTQG
jgi:NAD+ synthase (glutamine-hydrolysing)